MLRPTRLPLVAVLAVLAPRPAAACAPCELGDPTPTAFGAGEPYAGRLRLALVARYALSHEAGDAHDARLIAAVAYSPFDRLTLTASMPLVVRAVLRDDLSRAFTVGSGDANLDARVVLLRDRERFARHRLGARVGLALPTSIDQTGAHGARLPADAQTGGGAFAPRLGITWSFTEDPWAVFAEYAVTLPIAPRYVAVGPSAWLSLAGQHRFTSWVALRAEARLRVEGPSEAGEHRALELAPTALFTLQPGWLLQLEARVPVWQDGARRDAFAALVALVVDA